MKMTNRELETRYNQMRTTWKNLVNANVELVDENKMLNEEIEIVSNIINELEKLLNKRINFYHKTNITNYFENKDILDKLQELKGSDKK